MEKSKKSVSILCTVAMLLAILPGAGCATKGQTGALTGASAGALIGGLANMHGPWGAPLIINKPDYVENAKFVIEGNKLIIDYGNGSAVLQRVS